MQTKALRLLLGSDIDPGLNRATSPVRTHACILAAFATMQAWTFRGAPNRKGCPVVAKRKAPDLLSQVRGSKTLDFNYSHSFTLVCCGAIPIGSSLVVGFVHLAAESLRVSSRRRLGQTPGQISKLFRNRKPAVSFLSQGQK